MRHTALGVEVDTDSAFAVLDDPDHTRWVKVDMDRRSRRQVVGVVVRTDVAAATCGQARKGRKVCMTVLEV